MFKQLKKSIMILLPYFIIPIKNILIIEIISSESTTSFPLPPKYCIAIIEVTMKFLKDILKGVVIGVANAIPGVSGGTMMVSMGSKFPGT